VFRFREATSRGGVDLISDSATLPVVAPATIDEAAEFLADATETMRRVAVIGSDSRQGMGHEIEADVLLSTRHLTRLVAWEPDDMIAVVEAGMACVDLEEQLGERGQTAILPEGSATGTVGGMIATGSSGYRRYRYGPTRDRVLEVTLATGDGRVVTSGGRLVKNVTGYDIPRMVTGSFGSLGLIGRACLKLWPIPPVRGTVEVESPEQAMERAFRPQAVLETPARTLVYLAGTAEEVEGQASALGSEYENGHRWPDPAQGVVRFSVRVSPSKLRSAIRLLDSSWDYVAQFGVGEATVGAPGGVGEQLLELREYCESVDGSLVLLEAPSGLRSQVDAWGTPPSSIALQRRVIAQFDPLRVVNRGLLPGRL
jgi:glycolate oxidase FAD binding subunit